MEFFTTTKKTRKIIQLVAAPANEETKKYLLYALCNDGTVFWSNQSTDGGIDLTTWVQEFPIPEA